MVQAKGILLLWIALAMTEILHQPLVTSLEDRLASAYTLAKSAESSAFVKSTTA